MNWTCGGLLVFFGRRFREKKTAPAAIHFQLHSASLPVHSKFIPFHIQAISKSMSKSIPRKCQPMPVHSKSISVKFTPIWPESAQNRREGVRIGRNWPKKYPNQRNRWLECFPCSGRASNREQFGAFPERPPFVDAALASRGPGKEKMPPSNSTKPLFVEQRGPSDPKGPPSGPKVHMTLNPRP